MKHITIFHKQLAISAGRLTAVSIIILLLTGCAGFKVKIPAPSARAPKGDIDRFLYRVETVKTNFQGATKSLKQGRDIVFDIAATNEKKEQLKTLQRQLDEAESDEEKERVTVEIEQLQDEEIARAKKEGELENKKLKQEQVVNIGKLSYNLALAIIKDRNAIQNGPKIISDGKAVIKNASRNPWQAAKIAIRIKYVRAAIFDDLPAIVQEAPHQIRALDALLEAASLLKKNNDIPEMKEPESEDEFEEIEF